MIATIEIVLNWPAAALIFTIVSGAVGILWKLNNKIDLHKQDNDRHLTGESFVSSELCEVTKNALKDELIETRKYIGDVKSSLGGKLDKIHDFLLNSKTE